MSKRYTIEDVESEIKQMKDSIEDELRRDELAEGSRCPDHILPLFRAAHWLGVKLIEEGASKVEASSICFALGQKVRMTGVEKSIEEVIKSLEQWRAGHKNIGGSKLAHQLITDSIDLLKACSVSQAGPGDFIKVKNVWKKIKSNTAYMKTPVPDRWSVETTDGTVYGMFEIELCSKAKDM